MTFNARGLNDESASDTLKLYIQDTHPRLDILAIQEHKLRGSTLTRLGSSLWRSASFRGLDASPGYGHAPHEDEAGCGGVATFLAPQWSRLVSATGSLFDNRVHYFILSGLPGGDVGIANVYAPNSSPHRCALWTVLARELPSTCRWILLGDFNMVENRRDKNRPCARLVPVRERVLFDAMKTALHVEDSPRTAGSLQFSWDNQQASLARRMARLDRIYVFRSNPLTPDRQLLRYVIKGDSTRSDHFPVLASILLENCPRRANQWKMSSTLFDAASPEIARIWHTQPPQTPFLRSFERFSNTTKTSANDMQNLFARMNKN
jgi:exonuclease III